MTSKKHPVVLYPIWLAETLYVIPAGLALGCFFLSAFWFMLGYNIEWTQFIVIGGGLVLSLLVLGARAFFRKHVRAQHPGATLRFL